MWELHCEPIPEDGAFKATHNLILAHAHVVDLYRTKYKVRSKNIEQILLAMHVSLYIYITLTTSFIIY